MGIPIDKTAAAVRDNPAGTQGMAFIEFSAPDPSVLTTLFARLGFVEVAWHRTKPISLWRQGGVDFLVNSDPAGHAQGFADAHGPCVSAIAFRVQDAAQAFARARSFGAKAYDGTAARGVPGLALDGIGGSLLYLIDEGAQQAIDAEFTWAADTAPRGVGLVAVDHLTHCVEQGQMDKWCDFYRDIFGFRDVFYLDAKGKATGFRTRAMKSPCDGICIPVNEPTEAESQVQEYIDRYKGEGVQHVALASDDLNATVEAVAGSGIGFMTIPPSYYDGVDDRLPGHGNDLARLKRNGILIDGVQDGARWNLLLQIFSKPLLGPIFFEFIERRDNDGFGEGNAKALFEAIERDQIARGVVQA